MRTLFMVILGVLVCSVSPALAQENIVSRQNRTIEVVATETVKVEPDIAKVTLGCVTYGETHDEAYQANLKVAGQVIQALLSAGVSKKQIETGSIELSRRSSYGSRPTAKGRQFEAHQSWTIKLHAAQAQKVIDLAVRAGANGVEGVSWDVSDPEALQWKARDAAMKKARATAEEMAASAGDKLGELLYASNTVSGVMAFLRGRPVETMSASVGAGASQPAFSLKLFPQKVEKTATVRAIFALD